MADLDPSDDEALEPPAARSSSEPGTATSLALGFLAMVPMFAAYEFALGEMRSPPRNTCEFLITLPLDVVGVGDAWVRWIALAIATLIALYIARERRARVRWSVARIALEGSALAAALGPLLVLVSHLCASWLPTAQLAWTMPEKPPPLLQAMLLWGSGAWEELFFRVGLYSLMYLLFLRALLAFDASEGFARVVAELSALFGSALFFALFHLAAFTGWMGAGGEVFDAGIFTWRALAGIALALVFRWRGPGVAAWTHGLFNLALLVGIGPDVIL